eukprot:scaffold1732_cov117-Isochrysis_galbana.AAC.3
MYSSEASHAVPSPSAARCCSISRRSSVSTARSVAGRPSNWAGVSVAAGSGVSARRSEVSIGFHRMGSSSCSDATPSDSSGCALAVRYGGSAAAPRPLAYVEAWPPPPTCWYRAPELGSQKVTERPAPASAGYVSSPPRVMTHTCGPCKSVPMHTYASSPKPSSSEQSSSACSSASPARRQSMAWHEFHTSVPPTGSERSNPSSETKWAACCARHGPLHPQLGEREEFDRPPAVRRPERQVVVPPRARVGEEAALRLHLHRPLGLELLLHVQLAHQRRHRLAGRRHQLQPHLDAADGQLGLRPDAGQLDAERAPTQLEHLAPLNQQRRDDELVGAVGARLEEEQVQRRPAPQQLLARARRRVRVAGRAERQGEVERPLERWLRGEGCGRCLQPRVTELQADAQHPSLARSPPFHIKEGAAAEQLAEQ